MKKLNALEELEHIAKQQKSVSTSRLSKILEGVRAIYDKQDQHVKRVNAELKNVMESSNKRIQQLETQLYKTEKRLKNCR